MEFNQLKAADRQLMLLNSMCIMHMARAFETACYVMLSYPCFVENQLTATRLTLIQHIPANNTI